MRLSTAQIGKCGELLVQFRLLTHGIESSPLTTDAGIDLVAFSRVRQAAITLQVKTTNGAKPAGGTGTPHLTWPAQDPSSADVFAFVDLVSLRVWLIPTLRLPFVAQQRRPGSFNFFMATDPKSKPRRDGKPIYDHQFDEYLFENSVSNIFLTNDRNA